MTYIDIIWTDTPPALDDMGWGNVCFLVSGARSSDADSNPQSVDSTNYGDYLSTHDKAALSSYYSGTPISNNTYVYWMESGTEETGIFTIEESGDHSPLNFNSGPFSSTGGVYVDPTGGSNWQPLDPYDAADVTSGYVWETGTAGQYKEEITFESDGPYCESGGTEISGDDCIDAMIASGGRFKLEAEGNIFAKAKKDLADYDIQFIVPIYDITDTTGIISDYCYEDLDNAIDMVAGNQRRVIWSLPKEAEPDATFPGTSRTYSEFADYMGNSPYATVVYGDVTTGSDGVINDHPAGVIAGKAARLHPHENLTLKTVNISLTEDGTYKANDSTKLAWDDAGIICFFKNKDINSDATQINYGFTLSASTPTNRLNNVRCRDLVYFNIYQDLWSLLSSDPAPTVSKAGLRQIIDTITATQEELLKDGIIDGVGRVNIPLLKSGTDAEWSSAISSQTVSAISVTWDWRNSIEKIRITKFGEMG